jgi:hypothetical protein
LVQSEKVMHYRDVTPEFCAPCPLKSTCLGGCGASALAVLGEGALDPFVAQHVDDEFGAKLKSARVATSTGDGTPFVPASRLRRRAVELGR